MYAWVDSDTFQTSVSPSNVDLNITLKKESNRADQEWNEVD